MKESKNSEKLEMKIFSKVDVIHVVGNYEYQILKEKLKKKLYVIFQYIFMIIYCLMLKKIFQREKI